MAVWQFSALQSTIRSVGATPRGKVAFSGGLNRTKITKFGGIDENRR